MPWETRIYSEDLSRVVKFSPWLSPFLRIAHFSGPHPSQLCCIRLVNKANIFQSNHLFNYSCREQLLISLPLLTVFPHPWNLLGTYLTILDSKQNCVLISIPVKASRQALHWPYLKVLQFSCSAVSYSLQPHGLQHDRLLCPSSTPRACSSSCPLSQWCHPTISSSVVPFSSCLQYLLASGSFPMSQFFTLGGQNIGFSTSASVLSMNIQDWFSLRFTGLISLQSKGLSRVFSNTTVQKHQFFGTQFSL